MSEQPMVSFADAVRMLNSPETRHNIEKMRVAFEALAAAGADNVDFIERYAREVDRRIADAVARLTPAQRADYDALVEAGAGKLDALVAVQRALPRDEAQP